MKEMEFLEAINDVDNELLEDRPVASRRIGFGKVRWVAIAAALVLLLGGTVYAIAEGIRMSRVSAPDEDGYEAEAGLPLVKWSSFTGEIRQAPEAIARQYEAYVPEPMWSSYRSDPGTYSRSFSDVGEAVRYIGLSDLKTPGFPYDEYECLVAASGGEDGRVERVQLELEHISAEEFCAQEYVTVLTEYAHDETYISGGVWTCEFPRDVDFLTYTTPGGNECRIAVLRPQYDSEYISLAGYVAAGPALYELNLAAFPESDYERGVGLLHAWADALD